ncbi:hypothetical protein JCM11491_004276 [Sporobolomyces phaffii]
MAYKLPSLYAFSLPRDLIDQLEPRKLVIPPDHPLHPSNQQQQPLAAPPTPADSPSTRGEGGAYRCALTGASFPDLQGLKEHYRTDWYKYNVKLKLQGKPTPVSEYDFNSLVDNLSDSISGSESTSALSDLAEEFDGGDSSASSVDGTLSRVLRKQSLLRPSGANTQDVDDDDQDPLTGPRTALLWFEAPQHAQDTQYGVYRTILPVAGSKAQKRQADDSPEILQELKHLQLDPVSSGLPDGEQPKERKWTLLMFGGGHFAGMVVKLNPKLVSKGKGKEKEKELVILEKKTFHRYTTRRKQGGSQGLHDGGNGKAKSAGAQIRRHNEAALTDEVRSLLNDWREEIDDSELIFLRCSKSYYRVFMGYDDAVLTRGDPRIRGFTFPTRRPTIAELVRAFTELTKVKTSHLTASALAELDASYLSSITPNPVAPTAPTASAAKPTKPVVKKLTKLEELERDRWSRLIEMVHKGKVEAVDNFLDKYGPELESGRGGEGPGRLVWGSVPEWTDEFKAGKVSLLHVASAADQREMVRWLLEVKRADPTLQPLATADDTADAPHDVNEQRGAEDGSVRTPYELARSKGTRNEFRFMTMQHPDWWDWTGTGVGGARVPSGLDEAKEREKEAKEEAKREKLREKQREREAAEAEDARAKDLVRQEAEDRERREREERLANLPTKGPKRLGGGPPQVIQQRQMGNLTEEQKMRIQREERARAAEARLKRLG